jgi:hypothetical protein
VVGDGSQKDPGKVHGQEIIAVEGYYDRVHRWDWQWFVTTVSAANVILLMPLVHLDASLTPPVVIPIDHQLPLTNVVTLPAGQ